MAKSTSIIFKHTELAEILAKHEGITSGYWGPYVRFGIGAANISNQENEMNPSAIVPVIEIGIQEFPAPNSMTVDMGKARPKKRQVKKKKSASRTKNS